MKGNIEYFEFKNNTSFEKIELGSLFYIKKLFVEKEIKNAIPKLRYPDLDDKGIIVFFIDNDKDLLSDNFLDSYAVFFKNKKYHIPILTIGTKKLEIEVAGIDRRQLFLDSSIWNYYCSDIAKVSYAFRDIQKNYDNQLYNKNVTAEFIEFNCRLLKESKLFKGSHSIAVTPFIFHSEEHMKQDANNVLGFLKNTNLEWKVLLIDDYSLKNLEPVNNKKELNLKNNNTTKLNYIKNIFEEDEILICEEYADHREVGLKINVTTANDINSAITLIKNNVYDIILLDYLLGNKGKEQREYGNELFERINKLINEKDDSFKQIGPLGRFWVFPISSYSIAMIDKIRESNIGHLNRNWYIPRGADPLNTPQLFRNYFYRFLQFQIDESLNYNTDLMFCKKEELNCKNYPEILIAENLFKQFNNQKESLDNEHIRAFSSWAYHELIIVHSNYEVLQNDKEQGSLFAKSTLDQYYKQTNKKVWQHLLHLFYLLSSQEYLKSHEMWREITSIKNIVADVDKISWFTHIVNYIISLNNNNR